MALFAIWRYGSLIWFAPRYRLNWIISSVKIFRVVVKKEVNMSQFDKSNGAFNYGMLLTMYYFQPCFHRIGQVSNEEVAMLL